MGYLAVGDTRAPGLPSYSPAEFLDKWAAQPRAAQLGALATAMASVDRHFGLAQAYARQNDHWKGMWTKTFGLGAALFAGAVTLSYDTAKKAYNAGAKVGTWLAEHQNSPANVKTQLAAVQYWLQVVGPLAERLQVAADATAADVRHQVEAAQTLRPMASAVLRAGLTTTPGRTITPTATRRPPYLLLVGGALLALYWWRRKR